MPAAVGAGARAWAALAVSVCLLVVHVRVEGAIAEVRLLLDGLQTTLVGPSETAMGLPQAPPNIERDLVAFQIFALFFFAFNWGARLLLVEPALRCLGLTREQQFTKFAQSIMEAVFYGGFSVVGLRVVQSQEWVWPSSRWWVGFADGGHEIMRSDLRCYYILYVARYSQAIVSVLLEPKRKDFGAMMTHHVVTVVVILLSYAYGWNRVGVVVMALLDPADVPLHLAKLCKYMADADGHCMWQFMSDRLFELFALVFFVTRLVCYGYVCWSAHIEASRYFPKGLAAWMCVGLLEILLLLQFYWFGLIVKVAIRMMKGHGADDIRSDDEDEDEQAKTKDD